MRQRGAVAAHLAAVKAARAAAVNSAAVASGRELGPPLPDSAPSNNKPLTGYLAYRITQPNRFNNHITPPFGHVLVQPAQPVPGHVYNVLYITVRNGTTQTFNASSQFYVKFPGQPYSFPIMTGDQTWKPGQNYTFYVLTNKYYPMPNPATSGYVFSLGGAISVGIPGPSGIFLRMRYNPATIDRNLDAIVLKGQAPRAARASLTACPTRRSTSSPRRRPNATTSAAISEPPATEPRPARGPAAPDRRNFPCPRSHRRTIGRSGRPPRGGASPVGRFSPRGACSGRDRPRPLRGPGLRRPAPATIAPPGLSRRRRPGLGRRPRPRPASASPPIVAASSAALPSTVSPAIGASSARRARRHQRRRCQCLPPWPLPDCGRRRRPALRRPLGPGTGPAAAVRPPGRTPRRRLADGPATSGDARGSPGDDRHRGVEHRGPGHGHAAQARPALPTDLRFPINLATALRLSDARPLVIAAAQAGAWVAEAELTRAKVLWVPSINFGVDYIRHDGGGPRRQQGAHAHPQHQLLLCAAPALICTST